MQDKIRLTQPSWHDSIKVHTDMARKSLTRQNVNASMLTHQSPHLISELILDQCKTDRQADRFIFDQEKIYLKSRTIVEIVVSSTMRV